jgi:hypothetical protein
MNQPKPMKRSLSVKLGIFAVVCTALLPAMLTCSMALRFVLGGIPGLIGMFAFAASLPLAMLAWWIGARELRTQTAEGSSVLVHGGASRGVGLGKFAIALWSVLVLLAALTYAPGS